jgi:hypothetical protein
MRRFTSFSILLLLTCLCVHATAIDLGPPKKVVCKEKLPAEYVHLIGWSVDSNIAYCIEYDMGGANGYACGIFVQSLITDKVLWNYKYGGEDAELLSLSEVWKSQYSIIKKQLGKYRIIECTSPILNRFPLYLKGSKQKYSIAISNEFLSEDSQVKYGSGRLQKTTIFMVLNDESTKIIHQETFGERKPVNVYCRGYLASPFEDRMAVLIAVERCGWEITPHVIGYKIIGASLKPRFNWKPKNPPKQAD